MKVIKVNTKIPYNIIIKAGILNSSGELLKSITNAKRICIVSDSNVSKLYAEKVRTSFIGGKTGVDIEYGKNLVGAFYQPKAVIIDPSVLSTLNDNYFYDGLAEAIKYGCIKSYSLFEKIENENLKDCIEDIIYECVNIKRQIIENDEFESYERMLLNFGHTIGHSIETIYNYEKYSHGQAVSIGMSLITKVSENQKLTIPGTYKKLTSVLEKYNLPIIDNCALSDIAKYSSTDKKSTGSTINLILIKEIGKGFIYPIKKSEIMPFLEKEE